MGGFQSSLLHPDVTPDYRKPATFDPEFGFENGRKERQMIATENEMEAAQVPEEFRDYCAHHLIDLMKCRRMHYPLPFKCSKLRHVWEDCEYTDFILRMKEHERERRLLERKKRKAVKEQKSAAEDLE